MRYQLLDLNDRAVLRTFVGPSEQYQDHLSREELYEFVTLLLRYGYGWRPRRVGLYEFTQT